MFRVFEGQTADEVWGKIAQGFRDGESTAQPSRGGETFEILHSAMSISNPTQRWVTSRTPPLNPAFAIAEIVWIITGRNDSAFLNYFNSKLPSYAGQGKTYHGAYGHRLRSHLQIDQLQRAYEILAVKPSSRQVVLQIWDGRIDLPGSAGEATSADIPCNVVSILKVRAGKLEWMQIMRSNDIYRGLPYNIVQFTTIHEVMTGWLGLGLGEYNQISNSLHVYEADLKHIQTSQPRPVVANTDSLAAPKELSEKYFHQLAYDIESIIAQNVPAERLVSMIRHSKLPIPFRNMLCVLCAEGARRRGCQGIISDIMLDCTNPAYKHLYDRWLDRLLT